MPLNRLNKTLDRALTSPVRGNTRPYQNKNKGAREQVMVAMVNDSH